MARLFNPYKLLSPSCVPSKSNSLEVKISLSSLKSGEHWRPMRCLHSNSHCSGSGGLQDHSVNPKTGLMREVAFFRNNGTLFYAKGGKTNGVANSSSVVDAITHVCGNDYLSFMDRQVMNHAFMTKLCRADF